MDEQNVLRNFNERLQQLVQSEIEKKGITQYKLAEAIGLQNAQLSKYLSGTTEPKITALEKIASYFNVSADYMLGKTTTRENSPKKRMITRYTGLDEEAINNLENAKFNSEIEAEVMPELITSTGVINLILSNCAPSINLRRHLKDYLNYSVDNSRVIELTKNGELFTKQRTNKTFGFSVNQTLTSEIVEELFYKLVVKDIEKIKTFHNNEKQKGTEVRS